MSTKNDKHFEFLKKAFANDGFNVKNFKEDPRFKDLSYVTPKGYMEYQGKAGILAEHSRAFNTVTGKPKLTYYVEGTHFQMGFLLGLMANQTIERMVTEFADNIIPAFFKFEELSLSPDSSLVDKIKDLLVSVIGDATLAKIGPDVPTEYQQEMEGIYQGCKEINPGLGSHSRKNEFMKKLWAINFGIDLLLAFLSPAPGNDFPGYYNAEGESWKTRVVHGSVSLFELKERKVKSLFGYYGDEPVEITLSNYLEP